MNRLLFEKTGDAVYISHLDLMRIFQRAFKRADIMIWHSQGFSPRAYVSIALPLRDILTSAGAKVVMTRSTDKDVYGPWADDDPELQARCDVGNQANADVFVSIHIDSFSNGSVDGTTAYYYPKTAKDLMLAQMLHQSTMNLLSIPDRGVRSGHLYVNVNTKMPSVLMEMGYISNAHRVQMLTSSWGPKSIAKSLFKGLVDYFAAL